MKKKMLMLLAVFAVASAVGTTAAAQGNEKPYEGTTLTIMVDGGDDGSGLMEDVFQHCADILGVKMEFDVYPSDQFLSVANTKLTTGNAGDILVSNKGLDMLYSEALLPMQGDWVNRISDITDAFCSDNEGNYKAVPLGAETNMGLLYNKDILEECNITLPIEDYDSFTAALETIKEVGYTPLYISNKENWTAQILMLCSMTPIFEKNPDYVDKLIKNEIKPADIPELKALFERTAALRDKELINSDYMSATHDMGLEAVAAGECAFYAVVDNVYGNLAASYPEELPHLGLTDCPMWTDKEYAMIMSNKAISYMYVVDGPNAEAAKAFVNTMLEKDSFSYMYEVFPGKSPYEGLDFEVSMNELSAEIVALQEATQIPYYAQWNDAVYEPYGDDVLTNFWGKFAECVQNMMAGMSVEDVMDQWYNNYAADAKALRLEGWK